MRGFELSKWYADCISDDGTAVILYHARLRWRSVNLHYSSLLTHGTDATPGTPGTNGTSQTRFSLRRCDAPEVTNDKILWQAESLGASGQWSCLGESQRNLLFDSDAGSLDWKCVAPRAGAEVRLGEGATLRGWGYVEHLTLTLPPWQLPIKRLRWGRFVNATDAMVWIDWEGDYRTRVAYLNGAAVAVEKISDSELVLGENGGTLQLEDSELLRDGQLGSTALAIIPQLERIFPPSILRTRETKWLSRAVLRRPGQADSVGMAIHEVVAWP